MIKIVGDINFSDGYFDAGFGVGSSIVQGADPVSYTHLFGVQLRMLPMELLIK